MSGVSFEEEPARIVGSRMPEQSGLVRLVISSGLAKDQRGAEVILIGVFVVCVLASIAIFIVNRRPKNTFVESPVPMTPAKPYVQQ